MSMLLAGAIMATPSSTTSPFYDEVIADSPAAYWTMDGSGTEEEISGNSLSFDGGYTLSQAPILPTGDSIQFDGVDGRAAAASALTLSLPITIETLVVISTLALGPLVVTNRVTSSYYGVTAFIQSDGSIQVLLGDGTGNATSDRKSFVTSTGIVTTGIDYHIAVRVNSISSVDVFVNDTKYTASYSSGGATSVSFSSGVPAIAYDLFTGSIRAAHIKTDDTAIYNSALSDARISSHFSATGL